MTFIQDFEQRCGAIQAIFSDLLAIAQVVDEYTIRQQSNVGHGWFQFVGAFAQASMTQMMGNDSAEIEENDDNEEEEYNSYRVEYDEDSVSPLIQAIFRMI